MKITLGDVEFGYDRAGQGEPVLLVMGLGTPRIGWFHQFQFLSQRYDVVSFDNRGCGETKCSSSWTIVDMANDAVAFADSFGWDTFHLVGISMGGMISQELVLAHPDRVRTLTLIATTPGGPEAVPMTSEYAAALLIPDPRERMREVMNLTFGRKFRENNPEIMQLMLSALEAGMPGLTTIGTGDAGEGFLGQVTAVGAWMIGGGSAARLGDITAPTLVMHGGDDLLLPIGNGKLLERDIPGARARYWDDAGHALNAEYPDEVNAELIRHFEAARV